MSNQIQNFFKATISQDWSIGTGNFYLSVKPSTAPGRLVISPSSDTLREIVEYSTTGTDANGDYIVITTRGVGGTTEQTHTIGEKVRMNITAEDWEDMRDDIDSIVAAGAVNASVTERGIVEIATDAEVIAGTDTGETGAKLVATPGQIKTRIDKLLRLSFGDGSDGNITISSPTTLTRDMYYNNLTVNSTLTTNGFKIYVKNIIDGNGTIKYPTGNSASGRNGGNGFTGSSYGTLLNVPGSGGGEGGGKESSASGAGTGGYGTANNGAISTRDYGGAGGNRANRTIGDNNTGGAGTGGACISGGSGTRVGGDGGGGGASGGIVVILARTFAGSFTIESIGGNGANGGNGTSGSSGTATTSLSTSGIGGTGGLIESPSYFGNNINWDVDLLYLKQGGSLGIRYPSGAAGGGGGDRNYAYNSAGGGGGEGGIGGLAIIFYNTKTWTGSYILTGGTGGSGGTSPGGGGANGTAGGNGATGKYYEFSEVNFI